MHEIGDFYSFFLSFKDDAEWKPSNAESSPKLAEEHSLVFAVKKIVSPRYQVEII